MKKKLSLIILMLLVLINVALVSTTNSYAASNTPLENMNPGDRIIFAGKEWIILDPSSRFIILASNGGYRPWHGEKPYSNEYNTSTIRTYLNTTFLDSLGDENKALIQEVTWNCGPQGDEGGKITDKPDKIGLLTKSQCESYTGKALPQNSKGYWLLTPYSDYPNFVWYVMNGFVYYNNDHSSISHGVRPALYLKSGLYVSDDNEVVTLENSLTLHITAEDNKTISGNDGYNTITISGTVQDGVGSGIYYRVDGRKILDLGTNSGAVIESDGSFNIDLDLNTVSEGDHTLYIWALPKNNDINKSREVSRNFKVDTIPPTVSLTYEDPKGYGIYTQGDTVKITATFNEDILDGPVPQITITGANSQASADMTRIDSTTYTYTHTIGAGDGIATCSISMAKDLVENAITDTTPTNGATFMVDNTGPTVSLTYKDAYGRIREKYKQGDTIMITAVFNEDILEGVLPQITITGANSQGTANMIKIKDTKYTNDTYIYIHNVGAGDGEASCSISGAKEILGNIITETTPTSGASFTVDNIGPTVSLTYEDQDGHIGGKYKQGDTVKITATFSEEMMDGVAPQITIIGANIQGSTNMTKVDSTTYEYTHTVEAGDGTAVCSISKGKDLAGNEITDLAPTSGASFTVDNTAPIALLSGGDHSVGSGAKLTDAQSNEVGTIYLYKDDNHGYPTPTLEQLENEISSGTCTKVDITNTNTDTAITAPAQDGTYRLFAVDEAGNVSTASTNTVTVDKTLITVNPPTAEAVSDTEIQITPKALTGISLAAEPYLYNRDGSDVDPWTSDNPYTDTSLSPNTRYTYKYKAKNTSRESEYSEEVSAYTKALNPESVSQTSKTHNSITFKINNDASNGEPPQHRLELKLKDAGPTGENKGVSDWSSSITPKINGLSENTEYELWIQTRNGDGVENIKYEIDGIFKTDIYIPSNSSGGSSGGSSKPKKKDIDGDEAIEEAIKETGEATLTLENDKDELAQIIPNTIQSLSEDSKPLIVENKDVSLNFAPQSLITSELTQALEKEGAKLELGAKALTDKEKQDILENAPLGESTGIFEIGGKIFDFTAQITTKNPDGTTNKDKIDKFSKPVAVSIDLSELKLTKEEVAKLTGVRYEKDEKGNIVPVKLGGKYDSKTKTFTFYTEKFSLYSVVKANNLSEISLTIGQKEVEVNGETITNDVAPTIINDRTMVPVRFIAESFGAEVQWIGETRTVIITLDGKTLTMVIDQSIEGFDTPPTIVNDRTLVPLRYVSEELGANVLWFSESKSVQIVR